MSGVENIEQSPTEQPATNRLLESVRNFIFGKSEAFEYIYKTTAPALMAICRRYASSQDDAKDILQETYIKIYKNLDKFDNSFSFENWAKRIAINTAIDHYRKNIHKTLRSIDGMDMVEEEDIFVSSDILEYDLDTVMVAVQELPDGYRIILNLFVLENKSHREIAELLNITESTSRSQLTKARKSLKARFDYDKRS
jgi:RNA polymerase sigma factor (sigma-70 family)